MRRITLFLGWLLVVALTTTLTWQIVGAADAQVSDRPIAPLNVAAPVTSGVSTSTTRAPVTPSTSVDPSTTSSTRDGGPGTTVTTVSTTTTTTSPPTTATAVWQSRTVQTSGGTVRLEYRPGEVIYQSATPAPGYHVEVEKKGPPDVKVEFESESNKIEMQASWADGGLKVELSGEGEDDD